MKALDHGPALLLFGTTGLLAGMPGLDIPISLAFLCWVGLFLGHLLGVWRGSFRFLFLFFII